MSFGRAREPLAERIRAEGRLVSEALAAAPAQEALQAFMEKRAPDFEQFN